MCQVRNIFCEEQTNFFFPVVWSWVYIFEKSLKSVQDVIADVLCPGKYCLNREKCESLGGFLTTPRSIYAGRKCGAWLFVHKVHFMLQEQVKTTKKQTKHAFSFLKKDEIFTQQTTFH